MIRKMTERLEQRVEVSQDMLDSTNSDPDLMNTIITGDVSGVYRYDSKPIIFLTMKI